MSYEWHVDPEEMIKKIKAKLEAKDQMIKEQFDTVRTFGKEVQELNQRIAELEAQCITEGRIVAKCNRHIEKLENMIQEMIGMTLADEQYRKNTANRAQVLLDWQEQTLIERLEAVADAAKEYIYRPEFTNVTSTWVKLHNALQALGERE